MAAQESSIPTPTKRCPKCGNVFPATHEYFTKDAYQRDGLRANCKACVNASSKRWHEKNPEYSQVYGVEYYATHKEEAKTRSEIYRATHKDSIQKQRAAWSAAHKEAIRIKNAAYHAAHKEAVRARILSRSEDRRAKKVVYRAKNPDLFRLMDARRRTRKREQASDFTVQDWQEALAYWHGCCAVCGREPGFFWLIVADHWQPVALPSAPGTIRGNMVPLCHSRNGSHQSCNPTKSDRDPVEWLQEKLGVRKAKKKLKEIEVFLATQRGT